MHTYTQTMEEEAVILTDILGLEDALGTMDFKVCGDARVYIYTYTHTHKHTHTHTESMGTSSKTRRQ